MAHRTGALLLCVLTVAAALPVPLGPGGGTVVLYNNDDTVDMSGDGDEDGNLPAPTPTLGGKPTSAILMHIGQSAESYGDNSATDNQLRASSNAFQYNLKDRSALVHVQQFVPELNIDRRAALADDGRSLDEFVSGLTRLPLAEIMGQLPIGDLDDALSSSLLSDDADGPQHQERTIEKRSIVGDNMGTFVDALRKLNDRAIGALNDEGAGNAHDSHAAGPLHYRTLSALDKLSVDRLVDRLPPNSDWGLPTDQGGVDPTAGTVNSFSAEGNAQVRQVLIGRVVVNVNVLQFPMPGVSEPWAEGAQAAGQGFGADIE